uniref:Telomere length regulation protein conserved domain-containing protein n=1 Tax=Romanomermis culicivorax TaxID=13658 RepID=A0A915I0N2_ROMCU
MDNDLLLVNNFREVTSRSEFVLLLKKCQNFLLSTCSDRQFNSFYPIGRAVLSKSIISRSILGCLTKKEHNNLFIDLFCKCANSLDVISLLDEQFDKLSNARSSEDCYFCEILIELTINFVRKRCYEMEFKNLCIQSFSTKVEEYYDNLIKSIVNLPQKIAHLLKGRIPYELVDLNYARLLTFIILNSLEYSRNSLSSNYNCTLKFHSQLLGKLYAIGYGKICLNILVPFLRQKCNSDFVYRRIAQRIFSSIPRNLIEGFVLDAISAYRVKKKIHSLPKLSNLIGDSILYDDKMKTILTKKLIFSKYFEDFFVPGTILKYLKEFKECEKTISQIFVDLLKFLSMETFISKAASEQHYYYCQTLMICLNQLSDQEMESIKLRTLDLTLKLIQAHLKSSKSSIIVYGQVIGEILLQKFHYDQQSSLKFDYKDDEKTFLLKNLSQSRKCDLEDDAEITFFENTSMKSDNNVVIDENIVLDSDDDLEPYPIPDDEKDECVDRNTKPRKFAHLRDVVETLHDAKTSYDDYETAFHSLITLIGKGPPDSQDNLDNILKLLLHMEQKNLNDFDGRRLQGLTNACVRFPLSTSRFLIDEFYAPNNSLRTRFDCLDVLRISAKSLADSTPQQTDQTDPSVETSCLDYRVAIDKRLTEKTRYFCSKKPLNVEEKTSKFTKIAPEFFYPLLSKYDRPADLTVDLLNRDSFLLARLLYTAGCIVQYAEFCSDSPSMCSKMFEFAWNLRYELDNETDSAVKGVVKTTFDFMCARIADCLHSFKESSMQSQKFAYLEFLQMTVATPKFV